MMQTHQQAHIALRQLLQSLGERQEGVYGGDAVAAALFAGGNHDFLPAFLPLFGALAAEFDDASCAGYRKNFRYHT